MFKLILNFFPSVVKFALDVMFASRLSARRKGKQCPRNVHMGACPYGCCVCERERDRKTKYLLPLTETRLTALALSVGVCV